MHSLSVTVILLHIWRRIHSRELGDDTAQKEFASRLNFNIRTDRQRQKRNGREPLTSCSSSSAHKTLPLLCHRRSPRLPSAVTPFFPCSLARSSSSHLTRPLGDFVTVAPDALFIPALYPLHIPESLGVGVERDWRLNAEGFLVRLGIPGASSEDVSFGETDNRFAITIFGPRSTKSS